jgi:hypothetical protein
MIRLVRTWGEFLIGSILVAIGDGSGFGPVSLSEPANGPERAPIE